MKRLSCERPHESRPCASPTVTDALGFIDLIFLDLDKNPHTFLYSIRGCLNLFILKELKFT
jgi:hypothetical protein